MSKSSATSSDSKHIARKRFGQNFLHDERLIGRIIDLIDPKPTDLILEIGPGQAALTAPLVERCGHIFAIEIDRDLAAGLRDQFSPDRLTVIEQDVLTFDFQAFAQRHGAQIRVVGNLPYNISSPILFHLFESAHVICDQHVMLQKEVVDRMAADCGSKVYGRLSVMLQSRYQIERCLLVPSGAFRPAPKVESAIARMVPLSADLYQVRDAAVFSAVVSAAFSQRRKMLRNALSEFGEQINWEMLGISETDRAEDISVERFVALANQVAGF